MVEFLAFPLCPFPLVSLLFDRVVVYNNNMYYYCVLGSIVFFALPHPPCFAPLENKGEGQGIRLMAREELGAWKWNRLVTFPHNRNFTIIIPRLQDVYTPSLEVT